jgi:hypothetical protein
MNPELRDYTKLTLLAKDLGFFENSVESIGFWI